MGRYVEYHLLLCLLADGGSIMPELVDILVFIFFILFDLPHLLTLRSSTRTSLQPQCALDTSSLPNAKRS